MRFLLSSVRGAGAAAVLLTCALCAHSQTLGCETGGAGGPIPSSGTGGGGTFPTTLPLAPSMFTLDVSSIPPGATVVTELRLNGLTHTWVNDVQFVLSDPTGGAHNVFVRRAGSCDFNGDYSIVPVCTGGLAWPSSCTGATILPPGAYDQFFGEGAQNWPSGTQGILNTPLDSIAAVTGMWTLTAYDWAGGDLGHLTSFELCFGLPTPPTPPAGSPALSSPANGAFVATPVTLTWGAVACAARYDVDLDGVLTTGLTSTSFHAPSLSAGLHTWTVRAVNASGSSAYSAPFTFTVPQSPPASDCVPNGAGAGPVPASGTGGSGVWPTTPPATPYQRAYNVTLPAGATRVVKVDLDWSTQHTWIGDLQIVLTDPTGGMHNILHRVGFTGAGAGLNCDLNGDYSIYETSGQPWPTACPASTDLPPGDYQQHFTGWNSGDLGIFNTPLGAVPISDGNWTLTIYDWASGDSGSLADWRLCFDGGPSVPAAYCTAGVSTNGCSASISANAQPTVTNSGGCILSVAEVEGQKFGACLYGIDNTGFTPVVWSPGSTSFRCIKIPTRALGMQHSGGTLAQCDGAFTVDWDAFQAANPSALGNPWSIGDKVFVQAWYRDPAAPGTANLSNALEMTMRP
jgi:subtilisin-like proprotein convertase family protein